MIYLAIFGLLCGFVALTIGGFQVWRGRQSGLIPMMLGLPGLVGGIYHTWRLWP